jgi:cytochrome c553
MPVRAARARREAKPIMYRILILMCMILLLPATANAQQSASPKDAQKPAGNDVPKAYVPGLEQFMNVILIEHNKLWFAAKARNWSLAEYQLGEIKEVMSDVQDFVPTFKNLPLAEMLDAVITKEIAALENSIEAKDYKAFASNYDRLTQACNACHQSTGNGFIVIKQPTRPALTNQDYRRHE